jgi:hypothetical protein
MYNNQLRLEFYQNYYIKPILYENNVHVNVNIGINKCRFKDNYFNAVKFHLLYLNRRSNTICFYIHLCLLKKFFGNSIKFVYNDKILRNNSIKVGAKLYLFEHKLINFLHEIFFCSLPKLFFGEDEIVHFQDKRLYRYIHLFFDIKKFLFFDFFYNTGDYDTFYHIFDFSVYRIKVLIITCFKHFLLNRKLLRLCGLSVF